MVKTGNGNGNYNGNGIWGFGGAGKSNNGYTGTVTITGYSGGTAAILPCLRVCTCGLDPYLMTCVHMPSCCISDDTLMIAAMCVCGATVLGAIGGKCI